MDEKFESNTMWCHSGLLIIWLSDSTINCHHKQFWAWHESLKYRMDVCHSPLIATMSCRWHPALLYFQSQAPVKHARSAHKFIGPSALHTCQRHENILWCWEGCSIFMTTQKVSTIWHLIRFLSILVDPETSSEDQQLLQVSEELVTWKEHINVSSTLIIAPALSNSPQ